MSHQSIRVDNFIFPQIYSKFEASDKKSKSNVSYVIQDLPEDRFEDAIDFMVKHFIPDEANCEYKNLGNSPASVQNARESWGKMLNEKISLVCFKENSDEIVAVNVLVIFSRTTTLADYGVKFK
jgi:hypothetical protein